MLLHDGLVAAWPNALAKQTMHMLANELQRRKAEGKTTGRRAEELSCRAGWWKISEGAAAVTGVRATAGDGSPGQKSLPLRNFVPPVFHEDKTF